MAARPFFLTKKSTCQMARAILGQILSRQEVSEPTSWRDEVNRSVSAIDTNTDDEVVGRDGNIGIQSASG